MSGFGRSRPRVPSAVSRFSSVLLLGGAVMFFLCTALHQLQLPGLYYDEALDLAPMLPVMRGEPTDLLRGIGIAIGGYTYPVMLMDYMGSLNGYVSMPFMALLGPGVVAARLPPILFSAVTIILAYALARAWFGHAAGLLAAGLLAVSPSFIWFSRQGISVTSVMTVFSLTSLLLLDRWRRAQGKLPMLLAGVCLGLGLWAKVLFIWWIVVVGVITLVWLLGGGWRRKLRSILRGLPWVALGCLIGAAPLVYFNLRDVLGKPFDLRNAYTAALLLKSLIEPTQYGVNNLDVVANLQKAVADFQVFVDGSYFWYNGVPFSNVFAMPAFVAAVAAGSALALRRPRSDRLKWIATLAAIAVTIVISAFTVSGLWATHLFILFPLPQIVMAVAAVWLAGRAARLVWRMAYSISPRSQSATRHAQHALTAGIMAVILVAVPFSRDVWVSEQHHAKLAETGGWGRFSDAVYKLAAHLDAEAIRQPVALDWGIEKNVRVLTGDRVRPVEIFGYTPEPDAAFQQQAREALKDLSQHYIVLWDQFAVYNRRLAFTQIAQDMGLEVVETFIAHERSGLPVYVVLQAQTRK